MYAVHYVFSKHRQVWFNNIHNDTTTTKRFDITQMISITKSLLEKVSIFPTKSIKSRLQHPVTNLSLCTKSTRTKNNIYSTEVLVRIYWTSSKWNLNVILPETETLPWKTYLKLDNHMFCYVIKILSRAVA